ncbi:phosphoribosylformylglycinamidine cyclo-ligase [Segniliparus rugosus ATCC BAA-974]|uniref:Phosphoribosylformylglycinamidine cyclo-ligase n=1 Tax=Segniliparus rugosus (strain ATCC BAA-974 / DSM 45345 / CCUG 50838 / CIP 108380 / JCM 13579 / CDC 945) TaxID=679197 RepID=E5XV47_SEGRC|nr:phosphoribosylformylglycinamidine cyclo-ligase [Segniliparus rugosus ATCC BAA-974]
MTFPSDGSASDSSGPASYASAGVDIEAGERAVSLFAPFAGKATRPEVLGGLGGFAGLFALKDGYREPVLAASTDGVGTKVDIAAKMDKRDTVGLDLVAMVVDDLVVCGAEPLFLLDYIACGKLVPEHIAELVAGVAKGCERAGCALLGGETAEHPGLMDPRAFDLAATAVGVVEADSVLGPERVRPGDVVVAMRSSGLHSNGYSLVRHVLFDQANLDLHAHVAEFGRTLGEELLEPTRIYVKDCLALVAETTVRTFCHVTGGGVAKNLERVVPDGLTAVLDRGSWTPGPSSTSSAGPVGSNSPSWRRRSTSASACSRSSPPRTSTAPSPCSPPATSTAGSSATSAPQEKTTGKSSSLVRTQDSRSLPAPERPC